MLQPQRQPIRSILRSVRESEPFSDSELVARALAGSKEAEADIYARHVGYVMGLCLRLLGTRDEAEDAVQDTFVDVLEQLQQVRDPARLRHWIGRVAVHKVHRRFRRRRLQRFLGLYSDVAPDWSLVPCPNHATPDQAILVSHLKRELASLADATRAAWVLRYVDGYKLEEVAELCGCSLATAKRRIAAADDHVRARVAFSDSEDVHDG